MEAQLLEVKKQSAEEVFATIISYIFHPLLMPTYGFVLLMFTSSHLTLFVPLYNKLVLTGVIFLFTFVLPTLNAIILLFVGKIKNLKMESPSERTIPYSGALLYYFALCYLFYSRQLPVLYYAVILGAAISILLTLIINIRFKVSAHAVGVGGTAGVMLGVIYKLQIDFNLIFILVVAVASIVCYARLKLKAHLPKQVYFGLLVGFVAEMVTLFILL